MRPLKINGEEIGGGNLMAKNSLVPAVQELWNTWEIHCLILASLFLQVFLFVFAGLRMRSASPILHTVLWLAYLSADSVAIFVLGHLAIHASEPGRQLISFWAPFVLVHLGGQDTITALSRQDNELWKRHLLGLVSQVVVAGYVVAKASWPEGRLKAAMVLMFFSGCFKYAERTLCLYLASPAKLRSGALDRQPQTLQDLQGTNVNDGLGHRNLKGMMDILDEISGGSSSGHRLSGTNMRDILSVDAPLNVKYGVSFARDRLPDILKRFKSSSGRCKIYEHVGALLIDFYQVLYTKNPIRESFLSMTYDLITDTLSEYQKPCKCIVIFLICFYCILLSPFVLYELFSYVSTPIALVLFWAAEKGGKDQQYASRADIIVSYILLSGAIVLDVSSTIISIFSKYRQKLPATWRIKKQWSEELAQYNMMKRHVVVQDTTGTMASVYQWIGRCLGAWGVELLEVTHTPIAEDRTPIKEFILDNLLGLGTRKKWDIASSRGRQALERWMDKHRGPDSGRLRKALVETTIGSGVDFPTSVLIWHVATHICYYFRDNDDASTNDSDDMNKKHKQMSRELSNYIMYLVFKSGVMLTTNSQLAHDKAHVEISDILSDQDQQGQSQVALDEKAAVMKLFQASKKEEQQDHQSVVDTETHQEAANQQILLERIEAFDSPVQETFLKHTATNNKKQEREQDQSAVDTEKHQEPPSNDDDNASADIHLQKVVQSAAAGTTPVLPRACLVARELLTIKDEAERWGLIANVWAEMLYYVAPRCGCAFHYEHLSTGGEFITHLLILMKFLGPFLPPPDT